MSIVVPATSGHLGRLIVQDLLDRGVPAGDIVAGARKPEVIADLADAAAGRIRVPVTVTFSLDEAPEAFEAFRSGTRGKVGLQVR